MVNEDGTGEALSWAPSPWNSFFLQDLPPHPTLPRAPFLQDTPSPRAPPGLPSPAHAVVPSPAPHPPRVSLPMISTLGCPCVLCSLTHHHMDLPSTSPKSPALVAVLSLMSLIQVNQVSSLPCCDVFNLSALILASCLSTSTCPSLFPLLSVPMPLLSFLLSSWLPSVSLSLFLCGLFLFPCLCLRP